MLCIERRISTLVTTDWYKYTSLGSFYNRFVNTNVPVGCSLVPSIVVEFAVLLRTLARDHLFSLLQGHYSFLDLKQTAESPLPLRPHNCLLVHQRVCVFSGAMDRVVDIGTNSFALFLFGSLNNFIVNFGV